jgi:DNA replication protein DnaC
MLEDKIIACCKKLRLSRNLADMAMTMDGESHQEYLYKLLVAELRNREQLRTTKLINAAGFYSIKTFDSFRFDEVSLPSDVTPESLKSLDFVSEKRFDPPTLENICLMFQLSHGCPLFRPPSLLV